MRFSTNQVVTGFGERADLLHGLRVARRTAGCGPRVRWRRMARRVRTRPYLSYSTGRATATQKRADVPDNRKPQL